MAEDSRAALVPRFDGNGNIVYGDPIRTPYLYRITVYKTNSKNIRTIYIGQSRSYDTQRIVEHITNAYQLPRIFIKSQWKDENGQKLESPLYFYNLTQVNNDNKELMQAISDEGACNCKYEQFTLPKFKEMSNNTYWDYTGYQEFSKYWSIGNQLNYLEAMITLFGKKTYGNLLANQDISGRSGGKIRYLKPRKSYIEECLQNSQHKIPGWTIIKDSILNNLPSVQIDDELSIFANPIGFALERGLPQALESLKIMDVLKISNTQSLKNLFKKNNINIKDGWEAINGLLNRAILTQAAKTFNNIINNWLATNKTLFGKNLKCNISLKENIFTKESLLNKGRTHLFTVQISNTQNLQTANQPEWLRQVKRFFRDNTNINVQFVDVTKLVKIRYIKALFVIYDDKLSRPVGSESKMTAMHKWFQNSNFIMNNWTQFYDDFMNALNYKRFGPLVFLEHQPFKEKEFEYKSDHTIPFARTQSLGLDRIKTGWWSKVTEKQRDEMLKNSHLVDDVADITIW